MSQRNDEASGLAMAFAFVGVAALFMAAIIFALLAFAALVLTVLSFIAWNRELKIGTLIITPDEARQFVKRGIIGAFVLPAFVAFAAMLFGLKVDPDFWFYIVIAGYSLGSVGIAILEAQEAERQASAGASMMVPQPPPVPLKPQPVASETPPPFRFASWDDEDKS